MKLIAHRGNTKGPYAERENDPAYVMEAINAGFDAEVDVWIKEDAKGQKEFWLGHDRPTYKVESKFLTNPHIWAHAKDFNTFHELLKRPFIQSFYQKAEDFAFVSKGGLIWWHSEEYPQDKRDIPYSIITNLNYFKKNEAHRLIDDEYYGVCSDYVFFANNPYGEERPQDKSKDLNFNIFTSGKDPIDLLLLDVDGVMSPDKFYNHEGRTILKRFCDIDFTAIKRFKAAGVKVCILSGDKWNKGMAVERNIDFVHTPSTEGIIDKSKYLSELCERYKTTAERVAYIGDDYYDIALLTKVKYPFCPLGSPKAVKAVALELNSKSGKGCVAEVYDRFAWTKESYPYDHL